MPLKKNTNKKEEIEKLDNGASKDFKTLTSVKKSKPAKKPSSKKSSGMGRPTKFSEPQVARVNVPLTQTQKDLIDNRMQELGIKIRLDYIRSLIAKDIEEFEA